MPDSASTARFTVADAAPGASPSNNADAAGSAGGPSTSESQQEACRLPPELAEEPPGPVDPLIQVCNQDQLMIFSQLTHRLCSLSTGAILNQVIAVVIKKQCR